MEIFRGSTVLTRVKLISTRHVIVSCVFEQKIDRTHEVTEENEEMVGKGLMKP